MGKRIHYAWGILAVGFIIYFTTQAQAVQIADKFTRSISVEFGVSQGVCSLSSIAWYLGSIIAAPIWGKLMKKNGFQQLMSFCAVMTALGFYLNSVSTNIYMLIIAGLFRGVFFAGAAMLPVTILITSWFSKRRGLAMGAVAMAAVLGGMALDPLIQLVIGQRGWRAAELYHAVLVLIVAPVTLLFVRSDPEKKGLKPFGYREVLVKKADAGQDADGLTFKEARRTPYFYILLFASFSTALAAGAILQLSPYLTNRGYGPELAAQITRFLPYLTLLGCPLIGLLYDKCTGTAAARVILLTAALGFVCLINASNPIFLIIAVALWGITGGMSLIMPPLWASAMFGTEDFVKILCWTVVMNRLGSMVSGYFVRLFAGPTVNSSLIWAFCGALMLASMLGIVPSLIKMERHRTAVDAEYSVVDM